MMWSNLSKAAIANLALLAAPCVGHLTMVSPKPFAPADKGLDRDPLTAGQFPCRPIGDSATWFDRTRTPPNTMAVGSTQTLSFDGTAVHGGGSCQLALTKDLVPSASSSWQVILSVEGGCPAKDGVSLSTYDFTVPEGITPGEYVFSWSWMSKLAGQREYYMNCAPVTVTGSSAAHQHSNGTVAPGAKFDALRATSSFPELFVANLADINDCRTGDSADVEFPNPGPSVMRPNPYAKFIPVTGDLNRCIPRVAAGGDDGGAAPPPTDTSSSTSPSPSTPAASSGAGGGVYVTEPPTTLTTSTRTSSSNTTTTTTITSTTTAGAPADPYPTAGSGGPLSGPCADEGLYSCDGKAFQRCAGGVWSSAVSLPPGTECKLGLSSSLWR